MLREAPFAAVWPWPSNDPFNVVFPVGADTVRCPPPAWPVPFDTFTVAPESTVTSPPIAVRLTLPPAALTALPA